MRGVVAAARPWCSARLVIIGPGFPATTGAAGSSIGVMIPLPCGGIGLVRGGPCIGLGAALPSSRYGLVNCSGSMWPGSRNEPGPGSASRPGMAALRAGRRPGRRPAERSPACPWRCAASRRPRPRCSPRFPVRPTPGRCARPTPAPATPRCRPRGHPAGRARALRPACGPRPRRVHPSSARCPCRDRCGPWRSTQDLSGNRRALSHYDPPFRRPWRALCSSSRSAEAGLLPSSLVQT